MMFSHSFICVFVLLINEGGTKQKASLQETVEAVFGGCVVLPCSSTEHDHKLQDINVHWRHNNSGLVCDIIKGKASLDKQDQQYTAETFPAEYEKGNFSVKLDNLQHSDAGTYICFITPSNERKTVQLIIKESTAEKGNKSTDQRNGPLLWIYIVLPVVFIVLIAVIIFLFRKRIQSALFPSEEQRTETETV